MAMQRERITLPIYNLGCGGGGALAVERALTQVSGVAQAYVNPLTEMVYVVYDPTLANAAHLRGVIDRMGYGAPRSEVRQKHQPTSTTPVAKRRQLRHLAIRAGLRLAAIYAFCIIAELLFPGLFQTRRFWEMLLIGVRWGTPWTLLLGLVEVFLFGALAGWAFTLVRRVGPAPAPQ
jgi:cation transport ATPase